MRRLVFQPEADVDLAGIWHFTAGRWSVAQADTYTSRLIEVFRALPDRPPQARRCLELHPGLWRLRYGAHVVFFFNDAEVVTVVRILHERMDHLTELGDLRNDDGPSAEG